MPVSLLKLSADIIAPVIARLANLSFANGSFPSIQGRSSDTPFEEIWSSYTRSCKLQAHQQFMYFFKNIIKTVVAPATTTS